MRASCPGFLAALVVAVVMVPPASAAPAARLLVGGLPLYVQQLSGANVSVQVHLRAVAGHDDLTALTAAWLVAGGTRSYPGTEFATACDQLGFALDASATGGLITLRARVTRARFRPAIRLMADLLMNPAFAARAREAAIAAAASSRTSDAVELARRAFDPLSGRGGARLETITRDQVVACHRTYAGVDRTVIAVAGDIVPGEVEREMASAFLGFGRSSAGRTATSEDRVGIGVSVSEREPVVGRSRLLLARHGLAPGHPDWMALELGILSIFFGDISARLPVHERRLHVAQVLDGPDLLVLELQVPSLTLQPTVRAYRAIAASLGRGDPNAGAVDRARRHLLGLVPPATSDHAAGAHALLEALGAPGEDPVSRHRRLMELDRREVTRIAARYLR